MTIQISGERERVIRSLLQAGVFASADEVIDEALRLVEQRYERAGGSDTATGSQPEASDDRTARRLENLKQLGRKMEAMPTTPVADELSNRDHDRILYGR